jgi:hypothetical protein
MSRRNTDENTIPYTQLMSLLEKNNTTFTQLASVIGVSATSIYGWRKAGRVPKHIFFAVLGALPTSNTSSDKILVARIDGNSEVIKAFLDFNGVTHIIFDVGDF